LEDTIILDLTIGDIQILGIITLGCMMILVGVGILIMDITIPTTVLTIAFILDIPHLDITGDHSLIIMGTIIIMGGIIITTIITTMAITISRIET
jgi:hypothetical protein